MTRPLHRRLTSDAETVAAWQDMVDPPDLVRWPRWQRVARRARWLCADTPGGQEIGTRVVDASSFRSLWVAVDSLRRRARGLGSDPAALMWWTEPVAAVLDDGPRTLYRADYPPGAEGRAALTLDAVEQIRLHGFVAIDDGVIVTTVDYRTPGP